MRCLLIIILVGLWAMPATAKQLELEELKILNSSDAGSDHQSKVSALRPKAIEETAFAMAVQHAVAWRYDQINKSLEQFSGQIDKICRFNAHLLHNSLLMPPVVVEAGPAQRLENDKLIVFSDTTYRIITDARLLTNPPDWRHYLMRHHDAIVDVHPSLFPKNDSERKIWASAVEQGWQAGLDQAQYLFAQGLNRLKRDICGIIRYRILAQQGIVNIPMIASARNSAKISEKDRKLQISKTVVRLVRDVTFLEEDAWYPAVN